MLKIRERPRQQDRILWSVDSLYDAINRDTSHKQSSPKAERLTLRTIRDQSALTALRHIRPS